MRKQNDPQVIATEMHNSHTRNDSNCSVFQHLCIKFAQPNCLCVHSEIRTHEPSRSSTEAFHEQFIGGASNFWVICWNVNLLHSAELEIQMFCYHDNCKQQCTKVWIFALISFLPQTFQTISNYHPSLYKNYLFTISHALLDKVDYEI